MITLFVNILVPVNWCKKITSGFGPKARLKFILPNCCISFCKIFCRIAVLWFRTVSFQCNNLIGCNILMVNKNLDGIKNALVQIDRRPFFLPFQFPLYHQFQQFFPTFVPADDILLIFAISSISHQSLWWNW